MYNRHLNISKKRSFFLFGARATGKSTLLKKMFSESDSLYLDLLQPSLYDKLSAYPVELEALIEPAISSEKFIIIDEVQRVPAILDIVHSKIQATSAKFALTVSSARKLKRGNANLLAGRASVYKLGPLLYSELRDEFDLEQSLTWGTLPELATFGRSEDDEKIRFLSAYADMYIREEIIAEQIVRKLPPFRRFIDAAAQMNGKIINYSNIAANIAVDVSNVQNYFEILEDTLLGFKLNSYHTSIRKRQRQSPKFYWFDTGVARSLAKHLGGKLHSSTSYFGDLFEAFIITQIKTGLEYQVGQFELSYLRTKDDAEIDLIVERPGKKTLCLEIKSATNIRKGQLTSFINLSKHFTNSENYCLYNGKERLIYDNVTVLPWQSGLFELELVV